MMLSRSKSETGLLIRRLIFLPPHCRWEMAYKLEWISHRSYYVDSRLDLSPPDILLVGASITGNAICYNLLTKLLRTTPNRYTMTSHRFVLTHGLLMVTRGVLHQIRKTVHMKKLLRLTWYSNWCSWNNKTKYTYNDNKIIIGNCW